MKAIGMRSILVIFLNAKTKHGNSMITVTRKTITDRCPVNMDIRKCYRIKV